ncbi:MAG TPA: carboxypeptidase regulatory-like domain-containing protein [Gemmatimonadales bacterium]
MRVLVVLFALAAAPLGVGVSQAPSDPRPFTDPRYCGIHLRHVDRANANSSVPATVPAHGGIHGVMDRPCGNGEPPPPLPPPTGAVISGTVFDGITWGTLGGWTVQLSGTVTASAVSDASGNFGFTGLPAGDYTVCLVVLSGFDQTFPTMTAQCPSGLGYTFTLAATDVSDRTFFAVVLR